MTPQTSKQDKHNNSPVAGSLRCGVDLILQLPGLTFAFAGRNEVIMTTGELRQAIISKIETNSGAIGILSLTSGVPEDVIARFVDTGEIDSISAMTLASSV